MLILHFRFFHPEDPVLTGRTGVGHPVAGTICYSSAAATPLRNDTRQAPSIQMLPVILPSSASVETYYFKKHVIRKELAEEMAALQELIADLTLSRAGILKAGLFSLGDGISQGHALPRVCSKTSEAMAFCVDKSMSSLAIAQRICASITEAANEQRETNTYIYIYR